MKNLLYLSLVLFSTALSLGATINKCTEGENGLVYCEDISSEGQAFLNKRDKEDFEDIENITILKPNPKIKEKAPILDKRYASITPKRSLQDICLNGENDEQYGTIKDFALIAFNNITSQGFSLKGKVASRNYIYTGGFDITTEGNCNDGSLTYSVYTDEFRMSWSGGTVNGGLHYGTKYTMPDYFEKKMKDNNCPISNSDYDNLDFDAIERRVNEISQSLLELPATPNVKIDNSSHPVKLTLKNDIKQYIINIDENTFNPNGGYNFEIAGNINPEELTIVLNYRGESFTLMNSSYSPEKYQKRVIWNLPNATSVNFNSATVYGLIIAPKATVDLSNGNLYGNLICNSLVTTNVDIGAGSYTGCIPYVETNDTPYEEETNDPDDGIYEIDGVLYRNETVCSKENVESKEINTDIVFIFDESISMCDYIEALRKKLQDFITELNNVHANARFAVIGFGGKPRIYSDFTNDATVVKDAFSKLNCQQGGQESGLEAIRMFLKKSNSFINKTDKTRFGRRWGGGGHGNYNFVPNYDLEFREGSTRTIILVTDEDSDLPHYRENMNDLQIANLNDYIDVTKYYKDEIKNVDKFMAYPAMMNYYYGWSGDLYLNTAYSTNSYIEPVFSPARFDIIKDLTNSKYVMSFYRSGSPLVLSEPYQMEVDDTAKLLMKENIQLFMLLNDDLQKAQGEYVANSQFNDNNPYWKQELKGIEDEDDSSTITAQYGNPLLDDVSKEYNRDEILQNLIKKNQEKSIQGQLLSNRGFCRAFNIKNFVTSDEGRMVGLFYKTIVSTVQNCVVKPVPIIVEPSESEEEEEVTGSTTTTTEEIKTIYETPTELPTVLYRNNTSCYNTDMESEEINTDIVFLFDESASMCKYINPMREKLNSLIQQLDEANAKARFAVIGFGGAPRIYSSFTGDVSEIEKAFEKLNCNESGQESGLEAIRMFLNGSKKFINKIESKYGQKKFKKVSELKWRKNSTKTIILVTDEDSDLPIYEENFNEIQKANFKNDINIKKLDGKDIVASDVEPFGGFPYYLNKNYLPKYKKEIFFEPAFSPVSLTTVNGVYTFYRNGSPLVLSEAFQKEVDETANLINEQGIHVFMLLNDNLADSQGVDVANSQYNENNPYWISKGVSQNDDSSTITAQYGNPKLDFLQNDEYASEKVYEQLVKNNQQNSLQGQILSKNGFCRAFNMKQFTSEDSEKMVELFYRTVVKEVVKCIITPEILVTEITETITTTSEYVTDSVYETTTDSLYTTDSFITEDVVTLSTETTIETTSTVIETSTVDTTIIETTTSYTTITETSTDNTTVTEDTTVEETSTDITTIEPTTSTIIETSTYTDFDTVTETVTEEIIDTDTITIENTTTETETETEIDTTTVEPTTSTIIETSTYTDFDTITETATEEITDTDTSTIEDITTETETETEIETTIVEPTIEPTPEKTSNATTEPTSKASEPTSKASEPTSKASEPTSKASEPTSKASEPTSKASKPTTDRAAPTTTPTTSITTVEDVQDSTTIPVYTISSIDSTTTTDEPTTSVILVSEDEETPSETLLETPSIYDEPQPSAIPPPPSKGKDDDETIVTPLIIGAAVSSLAGAAAALYFKLRPRTPEGNQLADNVFEDNVGMENPLYEGAAGQNENPLYEANLDFDSLEDNIDAFA